jgi:hypothetical protein
MICCECNWIGFNIINILHPHEIRFGFYFTSIFKGNKLRSRVTCQPCVNETNLGWMLLTYLWLWRFQTILCCIDWSIIINESWDSENNFAGVFIINAPPDPHRPWPRDTMSDSDNLGGSSLCLLRVFSFIIWHSWKEEHTQSMLIILCKTR